jgi:hypothetical protein
MRPFNVDQELYALKDGFDREAGDKTLLNVFNICCDGHKDEFSRFSNWIKNAHLDINTVGVEKLKVIRDVLAEKEQQNQQDVDYGDYGDVLGGEMFRAVSYSRPLRKLDKIIEKLQK